jgi:hypothetical protein
MSRASTAVRLVLPTPPFPVTTGLADLTLPGYDGSKPAVLVMVVVMVVVMPVFVIVNVLM